MSDSIEAPFFLAGGALSVDAPSYIARQADEILFASLLRGEFCYVLVSRQMGKSSLMVRTAARLRKEGVAAVVLDLNAIGHNLEREQWYYSLILQIGRKLNIRAQIKSWWEQSTEQSGVQKWVGALEHILQNYVSERLVLFIDEIDQVQLLPSSAQEGRTADEFFAAVRSCYSRRSEDAEFHRLTFCLLGVALPSDLISDHRITPFNIGTRIELSDFDERQVLTFKAGLEREEIVDEALLSRVYYWTRGHPYLTQRLCRAIVEAPEVGTPRQVDELCERLFLSSDAQEQDDNLLFVRDRILRSDSDIAELLTLYGRIASGKRVDNDKANRLVSILLLSGIVRSSHGRLHVRNRIYAHVFNKAWVRRQMPDAEVRRQKAAYRKGVLRAVSLSAIVVVAMGGLTWKAVTEANRAHLLVGQTYEERGVRMLEHGDPRGLLYLIAAHEYGVRESELAAWYDEYADQFSKIAPGGLFPAGPEKYRVKQERLLSVNGNGISSVKLSPDNHILGVTWTRLPKLKLPQINVQCFQFSSAQPLGPPISSEGYPGDLVFNPDSKSLAASVQRFKTRAHVGLSKVRPQHARAVDQYTVSICNVHSRQQILRVQQTGIGNCLAISSDGRTIAIATSNESATGSKENGPSFSPLVLSSATIHILDTATGASIANINVPSDDVATNFIENMAFSPDSRQIVTVSADLRARFWNTATGQLVGIPVKLPGHVGSLVFAPTGACLAIVAVYPAPQVAAPFNPMPANPSLSVWNLTTGKAVGESIAVKGSMGEVTLSSDGKRAAIAISEVIDWESSDREESAVFLWNTDKSCLEDRVLRHKGTVCALRFQNDDKLVAFFKQGSTLFNRCLPLSSLDLERIKLQIYVGLGYRLGPDGRLEKIDPEEWIDLRGKLGERGIK